MKKKIITGLILGVSAGLIDIIPMLLQKLTWDANLSAFSMWVIIGFFMAVAQLPLKGMGKGLIVSYCVLLPSLFIIGWKEPQSLIPIITMTAILGGLIGLLYQRIIKE
jgi:hypothetical protein